jgi:hypothetical protein
MAPVVGSGSTPACIALVPNFIVMVLEGTNIPFWRVVKSMSFIPAIALVLPEIIFCDKGKIMKNLLFKQVVILLPEQRARF